MEFSEKNTLLLRYKDALATILTIASGIVAQTDTTLAGAIREIAAAQTVASDRLLQIMAAPGRAAAPQRDMNGMLKGDSPAIPPFNFEHKIRIPARIASTDPIDSAIDVLENVRDMERALSLDDQEGVDFTGGMPEPVRNFHHVLRGSAAAVWLLERILLQLGAEPRVLENQPQITYYCTRCLAWADEREDCACGAKKNYLRRCYSVP